MTILDEARELVEGPRGEAYGHPAANHGATAELWSAYLSRKLRKPIEVTARDVCWLNTLQKASRDANQPKRDNLVDTIGYAVNAAMIDHDDG